MAVKTIAVARVKPKPRKTNPWTRDGKALVSIVDATGDIRAAVRHSMDLIGGLERFIKPGDTVMLKPNLVQDSPPPVSTELGFLGAVVELLREAGARRIMVGEHTGRSIRKTTRQVFANLGYDDFAEKMGVELVCFDETPWVDVEVNGDYWQSYLMPKPEYDAEKLIYLPTLKCHMLARFTGALKLPVGNTHLSQRTFLHVGPLEEKVAELNLAWQPDLCIMDARQVFIAGGPSNGDVGEPGLVLASGDPIAIDVEGVRILQGVGRYFLLSGQDPWQLPMIRHAIKCGLGARSAADYLAVRA
ncbi:MAG: DUF362 domain-containing protein [Actinobacteria bacterium]|nr:DUF362 domain-containing protein [Actinomycetota bacterium]